jgi:hypothetical protein
MVRPGLETERISCDEGEDGSANTAQKYRYVYEVDER